MTPDTLGDICRIDHQGILEKEQTKVYHVVDVLPTCCCIIDLLQAGINIGVFLKGPHGRSIVDVVLIEG